LQHDTASSNIDKRVFKRSRSLLACFAPHGTTDGKESSWTVNSTLVFGVRNTVKMVDIGTMAVPNRCIWGFDDKPKLLIRTKCFFFLQSYHRRWRFRLKVISILVCCDGLHTQQEIPGAGISSTRRSWSIWENREGC
jgi:hypothetical protein